MMSARSPNQTRSHSEDFDFGVGEWGDRLPITLIQAAALHCQIAGAELPESIVAMPD